MQLQVASGWSNEINHRLLRLNLLVIVYDGEQEHTRGPSFRLQAFIFNLTINLTFWQLILQLQRLARI